MRVLSMISVVLFTLLFTDFTITSKASGEHHGHEATIEGGEKYKNVQDHRNHGHSDHRDSGEHDHLKQTKEVAVEKMSLPEVKAPPGHDHDHDHATGHGDPKGFQKIIKFLGKFHPLIVHFPIALILAAVLAEILSAATVRHEFFTGTARFCIITGAGAAIAAAIFGWMAGEFSIYSDDLATVLFRHRWLGVSTALLASASAVLGELKIKYNKKKLIIAYRVCLILCAIVVSIAGHLGATLVYGLNYFSF